MAIYDSTEQERDTQALDAALDKMKDTLWYDYRWQYDRDGIHAGTLGWPNYDGSICTILIPPVGGIYHIEAYVDGRRVTVRVPGAGRVNAGTDPAAVLRATDEAIHVRMCNREHNRRLRAKRLQAKRRNDRQSYTQGTNRAL